MRTAVVVACLVVGFTASAHADGLVANPEWFACEKDHDCGRSEDVCGEPRGVNLKQYRKYKSYLEEQRSKVKCAAPRKVLNLRELHSVCVASHCTCDPAPHFGEQ